MQDISLPKDYECDGQMSIYDYLTDPQTDCLIAVSKVFAAAAKQMNKAEWKAFILALTNIKWTEANKEEVYIDKKYLADCIGIHSDADHLSQDLNEQIGELPAHSLLKFKGEDGKKWKNGCFIIEIDGSLYNTIKITFRKKYMPLFQELGADTPYITMWADDLFNMSSERSILFYEDLRLHSDTRKENSRIYGIKDFKKLFNIPKDGRGSYMRKDGHFDRPAFEKKVITPLCNDLSDCQMINFTVNPDGKVYRKIKNAHGNVVGYEFQWVVSEHPRVASAKDVKELNQDPQTLKIAQDIKNGEKKPRKAAAKQNSFNSFPQNEYDFDTLEEQLLDN